MNQSTISNNQVVFDGGGIYNFGSLTVGQSTISGNQGNYGGGLFNNGSLIVTNSTISQNNANTNGGGLYNDAGTANIYNTTIVFNGADADADPNGGNGGGVYNDPNATFNLRNTLLAGNSLSGAPVYEDCTGTVIVYGHNIFWAPTGCTIINAANSSYKVLNSLSSLGPLQNNGGPTWTHALLVGSNAIDDGDPSLGCVDQNSVLLSTDQRGAARVVGVRCDVGAFEYNPLPPPSPSNYPIYLPLIVR